MALEEGFVNGDVLDPYNPFRLQLHNAIYKKHGIAVRQDLTDRLNIQNCHAVSII